MSDARLAALYPRYCFHLSPTVNTWCLLHAAEIHSLDSHPEYEGQKFFFYKNLPIQWVRVVGIVVAIDDFGGRRIYYVDDSSGATIQAMAFTAAPKTDGEASASAEKKKKKNNNNDDDGVSAADAKAPPEAAGPYADIDVGAVVDVKGQLSTFRDERQINVEKMVLVKTTAQEVVLWEKRSKFRREILHVPWVLGEREIRRCRKEAERSDDSARNKKKRSKENQQQQQQQQQQKSYALATRRREARGDFHGKSAASGVEGESVRKVIRRDAAKGKYSALGL